MLWCMQKWLLFPSPCWKHEEIFFRYLLWEPGRAPKNKSFKRVPPLLPLWGIPLEFLTLQLVHNESSAIYQIQFKFSYPSTGSHGGFCLWVSALLSCDSLYPPVSFFNLGDSSLPCDLTSLTDWRRVLDSEHSFSSSLVLLRQSRDF